jgi:hypothetical protein
MPLYDYECPHRHRFDHQCLMAQRDELIPCQGKVNQVVEASEAFDEEAMALHLADMTLPLPEGMWWQNFSNGEGHEKEDFVLVREIPCMLKAKKLEISFADSNPILDHGSASNRDAAREGRYDPLNPNRRFMSKGRQSWRR